MTLRALVVDDEPLLAGALASLLKRRPGVEVVGTALDGLAAVELIRALRPEVVFLDIQMPGLDGFQVLEQLSAEALPLVVFVTAYDQYALQAFGVHAVDYLLKPIQEEALDHALGRVETLTTGSREGQDRRLLDLLEDIERGRLRVGRFIVREGSRVTFLPVEEVEAIEATGKYMHLHSPARSHMIRETLSTLEARLDPRRFLRVHRSWLVALDRIREVEGEPDGGCTLRLQSGRRVPVSRNHAPELQRLLRGPLVE